MSRYQTAGENQAIVTLDEAGQSKDMYKNMKKIFSRLLIGFGAAQIIMGVLCFIINGFIIGNWWFFYFLYYSFSFIGIGIWTGVLFIITGAIGVAAGKGKTKCLVVSFNVLCIISATLCLYLFIISTLSITVERRPCSHRNTSPCQTNTQYALEILLAILAIIEAGCAIGSSVVCCAIGACCCACNRC